MSSSFSRSLKVIRTVEHSVLSREELQPVTEGGMPEERAFGLSRCLKCCIKKCTHDTGINICGGVAKLFPRFFIAAGGKIIPMTEQVSQDDAMKDGFGSMSVSLMRVKRRLLILQFQPDPGFARAKLKGLAEMV